MKNYDVIGAVKNYVRKFKLKHGWIIFIILSVIYVFYSYNYYNPTIFQIYTTLLTILVISLTMYTSNKELRGATNKQISTFKESIDSLVTTVDKFRTFLESEYANRRMTETQRRAVAKPNLIAVGSMRRGIIFADCILKIANSGGYAADIKLVVGLNNKQISIGELGRGMEMSNINCGRPNEIGGESNINIKMYLSDSLARRYFSQITMDFTNNLTITIPLTEVT